MAWLQKRGETYHISFFHGGRHYSRSLKTATLRKAEGAKARLEENLADVERGRLEVPMGADLTTFLLSDGKIERKVVVTKELTLGELLGRYKQELPDGVKDAATRYTEDIHISHLLRLIGEAVPIRSLGVDVLQNYVNTRSQETGRRKVNISHITIRKEIGSFAAIWNKWALPLALVLGPAPTKGLVYRKGKAKQPFQTMEQIQRQLNRGKLTEAQKCDLWDSVFLTLPEVQEVLDHVSSNRFPWVYPMFVFAAHTGARRSEILRSQIDDFDFAAKMVRLREKKKDKSRELTFRDVPLSPLLTEVMMGWLAIHPGGRLTICESPDEPISMSMSNHHFQWATDKTKWSSLTGWHVFHHSFASNCAARGIDQRILDEWLGHCTDEMRRRYRHMFPSQQRAALDLVFS